MFGLLIRNGIHCLSGITLLVGLKMYSSLHRFSVLSTLIPLNTSKPLGFVCASLVVAQLASAQTSISFTEVSEQAGLADALRLIAPSGRYGIMSGGGVAGDFNNDGYHDLFMLSGGGFADYLYINNQDGTFSDQASNWDIGLFQHSFGASAADFNNDGFLDIFVTSFGDASTSAAAGELKLYQNNGPDENGQWSFTNVAQEVGVNRLFESVRDGLGSAWGDYDLDGDLDLFVCGYNELRVCNRIFRNDGQDEQGQWSFTDSTEQSGIAQTGIRGFLPQLVDMNNDRYPDLILIADSGTSKYFVNNQDGTFTDRTDEARGIETTNGMGVDVGDINNDGLLDMYVTSITYQNLQGPGNVLLIQNPDQSFNNTAHDNGTYNGYWGWGTLIADLDHDGDRDIVETNGYVGTFAGNPSVIFENLDNGDSFNEVAQESGFFHNGQGRGMVRLDIENDGDLDIAIFENNGKLRLYQNNLVENSTDETSNWVRVTLDTSSRDSIAPDGIGAMINVITGNETQLLPMHCGSNHCSASPIEAHAGLGDSSTIDAVQVKWPDGSFTTITDVEPNQAITISASSHPADYNDDSTVNFNDIIAFLEPLKSRSLASDHNGDQRVNFFDVYAFLNDYQDAISP
jgi:enediyne biosynthesis protein E4